VPHDDLEDRDQGDVRAPDGDLLVHSEQQSQPEEPQRKNINARRRLVTGDWDDPDQSILDDRRPDGGLSGLRAPRVLSTNARHQLRPRKREQRSALTTSVLWLKRPLRRLAAKSGCDPQNRLLLQRP
jgi:hypothetical protein